MSRRSKKRVPSIQETVSMYLEHLEQLSAKVYASYIEDMCEMEGPNWYWKVKDTVCDSKIARELRDRETPPLYRANISAEYGIRGMSLTGEQRIDG